MSDVFVGRCSEGVPTRQESAVKSRYSECLRRLSVRDAAAAARDPPRPPLHSTAKKDHDAACLLRYDSIHSLPTSGTPYSALLPSSSTGSGLIPPARTTSIYVVPIPIDDADASPPLPPPPLDFQSEVVPLVTGVPHTYANVSGAVQAAKYAADAVESSFRPGVNACLSSQVSRDDHVNGAEPIAAGKFLDDGHCSSEPSLSSDVSIPLSSAGSPSSLVQPPADVVTPVQSGSQVTRPAPPPPPLRRRSRQVNGSLGVNPSTNETSKKLDAAVSRLRPGGVGQNLVNGSDAETVAGELQRRHLLCRNDARDGGQSMVAPLKIVREQSQMARVSKRSFSVDAADAACKNIVTGDDRGMSEDVDSAAAASDEADGGFLYLAERARQEYIRRRASVDVCDWQMTRTSTVERDQATPQPAAAGQHEGPLTGVEFRRLIAQKAVELQQNRATPVNGKLSTVSNCRKEAVSARTKTNRSATSSASLGQRTIPQVLDGRMNRYRYNSDVLHRSCHDSIPLPGKALLSSSCDVSETEPRGDGTVILLPPPLDFTEFDGKGVSNGAEFSSNHSALDRIPSPPPEFCDDPNSGTADFRLRPVATWSVRDVSNWLESLQMSGHCASFLAHSVDGHRLMELGRSELIALGVSQVGQRMNLERAIKRAVISVPNVN